MNTCDHSWIDITTKEEFSEDMSPIRDEKKQQIKIYLELHQAIADNPIVRVDYGFLHQ